MNHAVWPPDAPPPMSVHPAYRSPGLLSGLLRWLADPAASDLFRIPKPVRPTFVGASDDDLLCEPPATLTLHKYRATGRAVYVGRAFVYRWWFCRDDAGRCVAGVEERVYEQGDG